MKIEPVFAITKKGNKAEFRNASPDEAKLVIDNLKRCCAETRFLLSEPDDVVYTVDAERDYIRDYSESPGKLMLHAYIDGKFVGNASFCAISNAKRLHHRAELGIALIDEACGQGIGEMMIKIMLDKAKESGYEIMELDVFAKNERAIHLYKKLGFNECGRLINAIKYKDGTYDDEIKMQKML